MQATQKLVFMALCDDADKTTGLAMPGVEKVMQWAGCGRSQAAEHLAALIDAGYVERIEKGHRGQRAVYRVFAKVACCADHPVPIESGQPDATSGVEADTIGSGQPDPNPEPDESIASGTPDAIQPVEARKESGWPDAKSPNASDAPDANPVSIRKGSGKGPAHRTPPLAPELHPPTGGDARKSARARITDGEQTVDVLVALWLEHRGEKRPPKRIIGQVSKILRELIVDDRIAFEDVKTGLGVWNQKGLNPSILPGVVDDVLRGGGNVRTLPTRTRPVDPNIAALNPRHFGGAS